MKRIAFLCLMLILLSLGSVFAQAVPMPNYVLHAAQTLNAQHGANIDVNNVIWEFADYGNDLADATNTCPQVAQSAPAVGSNRIYWVEFKPVRGGIYGEEVWTAIVYSDLSFVGLCTAPLPNVTPSPGVILPTVTPSSCGAMPSRLLIGQEGRVTGTVPNNLRAEPFSSSQYLGEVPAQAIFLVLDGPRCSANGAWWYINYNGTAGWTLEGQSGEYYLEPLSLVTGQATLAPTLASLSPAATPIVCNPELPSRLVVGSLGRVTPGIPNNVRANAGSSAQLLGEIPAGGIFRVLAGPNCASGVAWWQVDFNGLVGWTGEGDGGDYWLEPQFAAFAPLSLENLPRIRQISVSSLAQESSLQFSNSILFAHSTIGESMVNRFTAIDAFATADEMAWQEELLLTNPTAYLTVLALGNDLAWVALPDGTSVRLSQRQPDGTYQERHVINNLSVTKAVFSPDARYLMLVDNTQAIQVFDMQAGQVLAVLPAIQGESINDISFSPDGRVFAAAYTRGFSLWQSGNWAVLGSAFFDSPQNFQAMTLNNSHFAFAVASEQDAMAFVVPFTDINAWGNSGGVRHSQAALSLALAPDSSFFLIATAEGLEYAALPEDEMLFSTALDLELEGTIRQMNISPDGRLLAIATDSDVQLWAAEAP
jgi:hypothetical protein